MMLLACLINKLKALFIDTLSAYEAVVPMGEEYQPDTLASSCLASQCR